MDQFAGVTKADLPTPRRSLARLDVGSVVLTDLAGRILHTDRGPTAERARQSRRRAGEPFVAHFVPEDQPQLVDVLRAFALGKVDVFDLHVRVNGCPERSLPVWVRASLAPSAQPTGTERTIRWVVGDLAQYVAAHRQLEQANVLKDTFLLAVSHDLRSPMVALSGLTDLLRAHVREQGEDKHLLDLMGQAVHDIEDVVANLLDIERLEHGALEIVRRRTDLARLAQRCVDAAHLARPVRIDAAATAVAVDPGLTERILRNLLANADRHSPAGGAIWVRVEVEADGVLLVVDDAGSGVPPASREAVFDLYHRLRSDGVGTGVGLYLVRKFAEAHRGSAVITESPAGGASVQVRLGL